ncbi:hypothetical protein KAJ27_01510 [bacterium]|nr:hypothetical protein [bacterium]
MSSIFLKEKQSAEEVCTISRRATELANKGYKREKALQILKSEFKQTKLSWLNYLVNFGEEKQTTKPLRLKKHIGNSQTCHQRIDNLLISHREHLIHIDKPLKVHAWSVENFPDCDPKLVIDWWCVQKKMIKMNYKTT